MSWLIKDLKKQKPQKNYFFRDWEIFLISLASCFSFFKVPIPSPHFLFFIKKNPPFQICLLPDFEQQQIIKLFFAFFFKEKQDHNFNQFHGSCYVQWNSVVRNSVISNLVIMSSVITKPVKRNTVLPHKFGRSRTVRYNEFGCICLLRKRLEIFHSLEKNEV